MLQLKTIHQKFNAGEINEVYALRGIDLNVASEEFVTIIGSNGAGKSTLFNVIAGEFKPTHGRIHLDGIDVTKWPEHGELRLSAAFFRIRFTARRPT